MVATAVVRKLRLVSSTSAPVDELEPMVDIEPELFFRTTRARELLDERGSMALGDLVGELELEGDKVARAIIQDDVERLASCGLVEFRAYESRAIVPATGLYKFQTRRAIRLTDSGLASLHWAGPPMPSGRNVTQWAADLVRAIADHYRVRVSDVLRGAVPGPTTIARARFVYALHARGWSCERIEEHFGMPATWATRGVERWKRLRARGSLRTGEDLLRWRNERCLTQPDAATSLGVSERTIRNAERVPEAELPRCVRRALRNLL